MNHHEPGTGSELSAIVAELVGPERLQAAKETFAGLDTNQDGKIELSESLDHFLAEERQKLTQQFRYYDTNKDGYIDFEEFLLAFVPGIQVVVKFREFDADGDGLLSTDEILKLVEDLILPLEEKTLSGLVQQADKDGDGKLTFYELYGLINYHGFQ